jgi:hypothetical protein
LGDGTNINRRSPVPILEDEILQISSSVYHTIVLKNDGTIKIVGYNGVRISILNQSMVNFVMALLPRQKDLFPQFLSIQTSNMSLHDIYQPCSFKMLQRMHAVTMEYLINEFKFLVWEFGRRGYFK